VSTKEIKMKRPGASTLSKLPDSQCARAIASKEIGGNIAVGANDGTVTIR